MGDVTFRRPPLIEVSFGLRFRRLRELHIAHYGLFWASIESDFPATLDQPPIIDPQSLPTGPDLLTPRVWLVHRDKALLLQLQSDRIHLNWRRLPADVAYPRFKNLAPLFKEYSSAWSEFADQKGLGRLDAIRMELSYVNHLVPSPEWGTIADIGRLVIPLQTPVLIGGTPPSAVSWFAVFDSPHTKVTADLKTLERADDHSRIVQLEIKAESVTALSSVEDALAWAERANGEIVTTFCSITSDWAQRILWQRVDN